MNVQVSGRSKRSQVKVSGGGSREEKKKHKTREAKSQYKTDEATKSMKNQPENPRRRLDWTISRRIQRRSSEAISPTGSISLLQCRKLHILGLPPQTLFSLEPKGKMSWVGRIREMSERGILQKLL